MRDDAILCIDEPTCFGIVSYLDTLFNRHAHAIYLLFFLPADSLQRVFPTSSFVLGASEKSG